MITSILNTDIVISHEIKTMCPLGRFKGHVIIVKCVVVVIPLVEFAPIHLFKSPFRCSV